MDTFVVRAWWLQKGGYQPDEYEDAYRIADPTEDGPLRVAIADGATGATFSAQWAKILCEDYAAGRLTQESLNARLPLLSAQWQRGVEAQSLPWYAQAKVDAGGSHAALLGVTVSPHTGHYQAFAVGDCTMVHLRQTDVNTDNTEVVASFPYTRFDDFGNSPVLLGTQQNAMQNIMAHTVIYQGNLKSGDTLLLMTDALAAWFLREIEKKRAPWQWLEPLKSNRKGSDQLTQWVQDMRDSHRLKNDDITLVSVCFK